jgi:hypothetical protein
LATPSAQVNSSARADAPKTLRYENGRASPAVSSGVVGGESSTPDLLDVNEMLYHRLRPFASQKSPGEGRAV